MPNSCFGSFLSANILLPTIDSVLGGVKWHLKTFITVNKTKTLLGGKYAYRIIKLQRTPAQIAEPITPKALRAMACIKR